MRSWIPLYLSAKRLIVFEVACIFCNQREVLTELMREKKILCCIELQKSFHEVKLSSVDILLEYLGLPYLS